MGKKCFEARVVSGRSVGRWRTEVPSSEVFVFGV
jgi:hypothetical protein